MEIEPVLKGNQLKEIEPVHEQKQPEPKEKEPVDDGKQLKKIEPFHET